MATAGDRLRLAAMRLAGRLGLHVGRKRNYHLVRRELGSPLPDTDSLSDADWKRRSALAGIELDTAAQIGFLERKLGDHLRGFDPPPGFDPENTWYGPVDAELAWAMVRHLRPRRVVELGAGHSTIVLAAALAANAGEGHAGELRSFDPDPRLEPPAGTHVERVRVQDVPDDVFTALGGRDVVFVDTSHVVKLGGDVNRVVLDVLPRLAPGVTVHFHDIWLPYEYHRVLFEQMGQAWNEQYLLQAFLAGNPQWQILFAAQAVVREFPERVSALVPRYDGSTYPSAFWIRRRDDA